jgi:hypothetical protein
MDALDIDENKTYEFVEITFKSRIGIRTSGKLEARVTKKQN